MPTNRQPNPHVLLDRVVSRPFWAVSLLATLLFAAGCTASGDAEPSSPLVLDDRTLGGDAPGAALEGPLMLEGGCLYVIEPHSGQRWLPVFPAVAASWDAASESVEAFGETLPVGATVMLGGGAMEDPAWSDNIKFVKPPAEGCDVTRGWSVFTANPVPDDSDEPPASQ